MRRKITNKHKLHKSYLAAIEKDNYSTFDGGKVAHYSITTLLQPPRIIQLVKQHDVVEDAIDHFERFEGTAIHYLLEQGKERLENCIVEKRFYHDYSIGGIKLTVTAKIDYYDADKKELVDFKRPTVASTKKGLKEDYKWQINVQARLLRANGLEVREAKVINYVKDWSKMQAYFGRHPETPEIVHDVPLLSDEVVDRFVLKRLKAHEDAKIKLPTCTDEETWYNGKDRWRCKLYCPARFVCDVGKKEQYTIKRRK